MSLASDATVRDLIAAGAVSQLCQYHKHLGGREADWARVHVYALREFRAINPLVIADLIVYSRKASDAARLQGNLKGDECLREIDIPGLES